jgi:hypothetical protein
MPQLLEAFDAAQRKTLRSLNRPWKVQRFLDEELSYNLEPEGDTCYSPKTVLEKRRAHCMEGAMLAALALRLHGHPPLLVDLEAVRDSDHVLAVYRVNGFWGSVAKSDYSGLRSREPIYRTIRELAISYFEHYYNAAGEKTLRGYSRPVNLRRFDRYNWMASEEDVWVVPNRLCEVAHTPVVRQAMLKHVARMDRRLYDAGRLGGLAH